MGVRGDVETHLPIGALQSRVQLFLSPSFVCQVIFSFYLDWCTGKRKQKEQYIMLIDDPSFLPCLVSRQNRLCP